MAGGVTVCCFDLDDTLVLEADYVASGLRAAAVLLEAERPGDPGAGDWVAALWARERCPDALQRLLARRGLPLEPWLGRLRAAYRAHAPALRLRPGAPEVLAALVARGHRLALISDGYADVQRRKWAALAPSLPFTPVIFTDERGRAFWKPHPWAFREVMAAHPDAARFAYVADNPAKDFVAPNALGWTTVQLRDPRGVHAAVPAAQGGAPRLTLDRIEELPAALGS